jgi:hypothetical protein
VPSIQGVVQSTIKYYAVYSCRPSLDQLYLSAISDRTIQKGIFFKELSKVKYHPQKSSVFLNSKIKLAKDLSRLLSNFPNILFIGVTGSVASFYPQKNDDIDLIIITKDNTLWSTRFLLKLFLIYKKIPHRHHGDIEESDNFCFNLWLDNSSLTIPIHRQNLRNAMDLILLIPLYNQNQTHQQFIEKNFWVKKYLATGFDLLLKKNKNSPKLIPQNNSIITKLIKNCFQKSIDFGFFVIQFVFMFPKKTTESISLHSAFFHQK